tara:strand:- start:986 stop:1270 length:285 start_codon:yes stop_codon:yes gene_type:complete
MKPIIPTDDKERKEINIYSGVIKYFPRAMVAIAKRSARGSKQLHPHEPMHWDRDKSPDELDSMMRHIIEKDWDAVAWRALANLEKKLEDEADEI